MRSAFIPAPGVMKNGRYMSPIPLNTEGSGSKAHTVAKAGKGGKKASGKAHETASKKKSRFGTLALEHPPITIKIPRRPDPSFIPPIKIPARLQENVTHT